MTDFSPDAVARAVLLAELAKADEQIVNAEKSMLAAAICLSAARGTVQNVRAALAQPQKPLRKLALIGPYDPPPLQRFDLVQESGRPADHEIERRFISPQGDGGDDAE